MTYENTVIYLQTAIACGVWCLVGLLIVRLVMLGKNSRHMLALGFLVGSVGAANAQETGTATFTGAGFDAVPYVDALPGVSNVAGNWQVGSGGRDDAYCGLIAASPSVPSFTVNAPAGGSMSFYLYSHNSMTSTVTVRRSGNVVTSATVYNNFQWVLVEVTIPAGTHSYTFTPSAMVKLDTLSVSINQLPLGEYSLSVSPSTVDIRPGEYAVLTVGVTGNSWTGASSVPVSLQFPSQVSGSWNSLLIPVGGSSTVNVSNTGSVATTVSMTATSSSASFTAPAVSATLNLLPPRSYNLLNSFVFTGAVSALDLGPGESASFDVWAESSDWTAGPLALSITGLPPGFSYVASGPIPVNAVGVSSPRATVTVTAPSEGSDAVYTFTVGAVGGGQTASFGVDLNYIGPAVCDGVRTYRYSTTTGLTLIDEIGSCGVGCEWCFDELSQACDEGPANGAEFLVACVLSAGNCSVTTVPDCVPDDPGPDPDPEPCPENECSCADVYRVATWVTNAFGTVGTWQVEVFGCPAGAGCDECEFPPLPANGSGTRTDYATGCYVCENPPSDCENEEGVTGAMMIELVECAAGDCPGTDEAGYYWSYVGLTSGTSNPGTGFVIAGKRACLPSCGVIGESYEIPIMIQPSGVPNPDAVFGAEGMISTYPLGTLCDDDADCISLPDMLAELQQTMEEKGFEASFEELDSGDNPKNIQFNLPCSLDGSCYFPVTFSMTCQAADSFLGFTPSGPRTVGLLCYCVSLLQIFFKMQLGWFFVKTFVGDLGRL